MLPTLSVPRGRSVRRLRGHLRAFLLCCSLASPACWPLAAAIDFSSPLPELAAAVLDGEPGTATVARWREGRLESYTLRTPVRGAPVSAPPDSEPLYEIGSISKVFTGLLLAQAVEAGELRLDDRIGDLLRGQVEISSPHVAVITLRQLVTHTACLPRQFGRVAGARAAAQITDTDRATLWAALAAQPLARAAPCPALYSNYGMAVLGEIMAHRLGLPWSELVRRRITEPLGLRDTQVVLGDKAPRLAPAFAGQEPASPWNMSAFAPAGGLRATAADLVVFGRALLQGRQGALGVAAERVLQPLATMDGAGIGHAIFVLGPEDHRTWMHDGLTGGYRALLLLSADTGEVVAALASNRMAPLPRAGSELVRARYPVKAVAIAPTGLPMADYAGVYATGDDGKFEIALAGGVLHARSRTGVFRAYMPTARDEFARPAGGARLSFARDAQGRVDSMTLDQAGRSFRAVRTAQAGEPSRPLAAGEAAPYLGRYLAPRIGRSPVEFRVGEEAGQLIIRSSSVDWQAIFPMAGQGDRFQYDVPAWLQFERDAAGRVQALVLHENGGTLRATREAAVVPAPASAGRD